MNDVTGSRRADKGLSQKDLTKATWFSTKSESSSLQRENAPTKYDLTLSDTA
jgi:hypothetical protein